MITFTQIEQFLKERNIQFEVKHHPPTRTSEESAYHRKEPIKIGAKALLVKGEDGFSLAVIPANRLLDTKSVKKILHTKNLRFATQEELKELTGLVPGSVPPFGNLMNISMLVDKALFEEEWMAFNAASLEISIKMRTKDYRGAVNPQVEEMSQEKIVTTS